MHGEDEPVAVGGLPHHERPDQRPLGEVEGRLGLPVQQLIDPTLPLRGIELGQVDERHLHGKRRPDLLARAVGRDDDAQRVVPGHDLIEGRAQGLDAQCAVQLEREALVVHAIRLGPHRRGGPHLGLRLGQGQACPASRSPPWRRGRSPPAGARENHQPWAAATSSI